MSKESDAVKAFLKLYVERKRVMDEIFEEPIEDDNKELGVKNETT